MHQRQFAATDRAVSEVGVGTWQLGGSEWGNVSDQQALDTLVAAAEAGVTLIDTADIYGLGRSETLIGTFLKEYGHRDRFFIATKLGRHPQPGLPDNLTREVVFRHTEDSLRRLGVDALDLAQTHCVPFEQLRQGDVFGHLDQLKQQGKIKAFGASVESMEEALACLQVEGLASLQIIFNIFRQRAIDELLSRAQQQQVALIVRLPLASGLLAGKFTADTVFAENDHRSFNRDGARFNVGETFAGLEFSRGVKLADRLKPLVPSGMTMAQFAIRWCLDFDEVTTVIPGAKYPEQAAMNVAASELPPLSDELHDELRRFYQEQVVEHLRGPL